MLHIDTIEIDDHILEKIEAVHGVSLEEAEEACYTVTRRHIRRGREGLYEVWSRTDDGRHLLVVLADQGAGVCKLVTAREMTDSERRSYRRAKGLG